MPSQCVLVSEAMELLGLPYEEAILLPRAPAARDHRERVDLEAARAQLEMAVPSRFEHRVCKRCGAVFVAGSPPQGGRRPDYCINCRDIRRGAKRRPVAGTTA